MSGTMFLLILFLVSTCHGEAPEGLPVSGISATTKWKNKAEALLELACPEPTDIEPCECTTGNFLSMDCSKVQDEEQLRKVFSSHFPDTVFSSFSIKKNNDLKVLEDGVFGNVSFQSMDITESALEIIENDALTPSLSTLISVWIEDCQLSQFPFERLAEFTKLKYLRADSNKIDALPALSSSSLQILSLTHNAIAHLSPDVFKLLPAVESIHLRYNQLTEIPQGTFTGLPKLEYLHISNNNITHLHSLTFELFSSVSSNTNLALYSNNIESVEVDTFKGATGNVYISMRDNALTRLPEEVWRPVLEDGTVVTYEGNPLECGCDVAWLVRYPPLLARVTDAQCADGTMLTDLNAVDFVMCD